jgi:hypothetical protein
MGGFPLQLFVVDDQLATVVEGEQFARAENADIAETAKDMFLRFAPENMSAILDEVEASTVAEFPDFADVLRESKIVDCHDGTRAGGDSAFEIGKVHEASARNIIEDHIYSAGSNRFNR